jgi:S1-C subfamily serine protease
LALPLTMTLGYSPRPTEAQNVEAHARRLRATERPFLGSSPRSASSDQVWGKPMYRLLVATFVALFAIPLAIEPAFPRVKESPDAEVAAMAMPAVVNIATWKLRPPVEPGGPPRRIKAYGSGFIIDPSGIIVTNRHVIDGAFDIKVNFDNGERATGKLIAIAPMTDLAVLKVDVDRALCIVTFRTRHSTTTSRPTQRSIMATPVVRW